MSCDGSSSRAGRVTDKGAEQVLPSLGLCKDEPASMTTCRSPSAVLTPAFLSVLVILSGGVSTLPAPDGSQAGSV